MALLEQVYKKIVKLGLLPKLIRALPILPLILAIIGLGWISLLPDDGQYRRTYISENALLPSQAYSYFRESEWNIVRGYRDEILKFNREDKVGNLQEMQTWIEDIGFKTHIHTSEFGDTLYGIWHVPKGDDTESMVLGAAYFNSDGDFNVGGMALSIALGRYFHRWNIWSKNIIIVIPENPNLALRHWVNAYHGDLDLTGGSIEAALMLDYASDSDNFDYTELYYEGLNGQLPNLDYINVAVSVAEHEGSRISLHRTPKEELWNNDYTSRLTILLKSIKELALAGIRRPHGNEAFSGWRIQAITLKAIGFTGANDITTFGRIPEAVFRSVNNLLEKFHQSFFFYLMLAPRHFISIGTYLPSAGFFAGSFLLSCLDKMLNSGFEVNYLLKFAPNAALFFVAVVACALAITLGYPLLPTNTHYVLIAVSVVASVAVSSIKIRGYNNKEKRILLRAISALYYTIVLASLLVLNFSLTFAIGTFAIPLCFVNEYPRLSKPVNNVLNTLLLLISNPFILSVFFSLDFEGGVDEFYQGLIESWVYLDSYTWGVVVLGWGAVWAGTASSLMLVDLEREEKVNTE
ncbi:hypothetical protein WICPIJ_002166 [Wickerhamomyces pijperi]|uniref:GPI transamidase component GAA1 n=1 Tax=Wickerhamomyces pijperi TaxID=599730 RepID=A0A9P8TQ39_WICPI|nr:hypothetical protein WICPIJ_002166 [Wickerhamomyces pijperi]